MARKAIIERNKKRERMVAKYAEKRRELKRTITNPDTPDEEFFEAQRKLTELPRNSSKVRMRNRCSITGRGRAYHRRFGLSRITLREFAADGKIPGLVKSSW